jgi:hypothetical protein
MRAFAGILGVRRSELAEQPLTTRPLTSRHCVLPVDAADFAGGADPARAMETAP